jgi:hypothetical protein
MQDCNKLCAEFRRDFITLQPSKMEDIKYFMQNTPMSKEYFPSYMIKEVNY